MSSFVMSPWHQEPLASHRSLKPYNKLLGGPQVFLSATEANSTDWLFWSLKQIIRWRSDASVKAEGRSHNRWHTSALTPFNPQWGIQTQHLGSSTPSPRALALTEKGSPSPVPTGHLWQALTALRPQARCLPLATGTRQLPHATLSRKGSVFTHESSCELFWEPPVAMEIGSALVIGGAREGLTAHKEVLCVCQILLLWTDLSTPE